MLPVKVFSFVRVNLPSPFFWNATLVPEITPSTLLSFVTSILSAANSVIESNSTDLEFIVKSVDVLPDMSPVIFTIPFVASKVVSDATVTSPVR